MIAPCGLNCGVCRAYLRSKNPCAGCRSEGSGKPRTCRRCSIRACEQRKGTFCVDCASFPCPRLRRLDERYRRRYRVSPLENLITIARAGVRQFVAGETARWVCPSCGARLCVHEDSCVTCGARRPRVTTLKLQKRRSPSRPNKSLQPTATAVMPPAVAGDHASRSRG
jgi:hypothetical protein